MAVMLGFEDDAVAVGVAGETEAEADADVYADARGATAGSLDGVETGISQEWR